MPTQAKGYISGTIFVGLLLLAAGLWGWTSTGLLRYLSFLLLALFASTQKFRLPGIRGTMSAAFVFVLIAIADFSFGETMVMACSTALVQSLWKARRRNVSFQV